MKKKFLIISGIVIVVLVLGISLFLILNNEDKTVKLKDFSYVNVEEIKPMEVSTLKDNDDNVIIVRDVRISSGYLEGTILLYSDKNYEKLKVMVCLYDEEGNLIDEINFEFENVSPYEERDLFYAIQKDLSNAYYVDVKEG